MIRIEEVPSRRYDEAMGFLAAGARRDRFALARGKAFKELAGNRQGCTVKLWWALKAIRPVAAVMIIAGPGRTGMLFHSSASERTVEAGALSKLLAAASRQALDGGVALVEALPDPSARADINVLQSAGFVLLAELIYMRRELDGLTPPTGDQQLRLLDYDQFDEAELADVIASTYRGSRDCPSLAEVREMEDVIAGHKASGVFQPKSWWIAEYGGVRAGCILVNDSACPGSAEVVYMGVVPACRGKGLGRAMLSCAMWNARSRARKLLTLAVDEGNTFARDVYEQEGFYETARRLAYVMIRKTPR